MDAALSAGLEDQLAALHREGFAWAVGCCDRDHAEAEDVLQTAYIRVLTGAARFDGRSALRTWFFGVIRNVARERRRQRSVGRRLGETMGRWWRDQPVGSDPERGAIEDEQVHRLHAALNRLPRRQAEVLRLLLSHELTLQQAAEVLDLPIGTVRTHYERGKARLREWLLAAGQGTGR